MSTTTIDLNSTPIETLNTFRSPCNEDFPIISYKNSSFHEVIKSTTKYCSDILWCMFNNLEIVRKYLYVDIKTHDLKVGDNPANGLWHLDSDLKGRYEFENQLFVSSKNCLTEFVETPMTIRACNSSKEFDTVVTNLKPDVVAIPSNTIIKYNGGNVHRSVPSLSDERRLLIRLINTDKKLPSYKIPLNTSPERL